MVNTLSVLATIGNAIKGIARGVRLGLISMEPGYGVEIAKAKIKNALKTIGKIFLTQFLSYALILVIVISAVGIVFEIFAYVKNLFSPFDVDVKEMKEWAEGLSEEEIEEMQEYGASIHPQKIERYLEIEDNSYPKNINIQVPIITKVWKNGALVSEDKTYKEFTLPREDKTYMYRQWWQSTASIDAINETAIYKNRWNIVNKAENQLKPVFVWINSMVESMKEGDTYREGSGPELTITTTTEEVVTTTSDSGSYTDITVTEVTEYYPIVELEEAITMFAKHQFSYEPVVDISSEETSYSYENVYTEIVINDEGEEEEVSHVEVVDVNIYTETEVNSLELTGSDKEFLSTFFDFLYHNDIDTNSDPEVMYFMAEQLPQNYDYLSQFEEYLYYMEDMTLYGEFRGGLGAYQGHYEILPSDLVRDIPLFLQTDPRWARVPYSYVGNPAHGTIGSSACGPTSAAMVITGLGGYDQKIDSNGDGIIDPYEASMYSLEKGHRVYGQGTSWAYFSDIGKATGLKVSQKSPMQYEDVIYALQKGNPVVASMGPGAFTRGGHFIVLVGINENGMVIVNDPNSTSRSNVAWDFYNPILMQVKQFWIFSK